MVPSGSLMQQSEARARKGISREGTHPRAQPGPLAIVIETRDGAGERRRKWHSFAGTKRGAQIECAKLISEVTTGTSLDPTKVMLREYLGRWLAHIATQVSPRSAENYREVVEFWIVPALGNVKLARLQPEQIAQAYSDALTSGGRNGTGLSAWSVAMMHRTLSQSLKQAVIWNLIGKNPASLCKPPRLERKQMNVLDMDSTASLIEFAKGGRLHVPVMLCALCGVRRAEVAAIRWNRLDLDAGRLSVSTSIEQTASGTREKPPKNGRSRSVTLPALLVEELRKHRLRQAEDLLRLGVRQTADTHVCLREDGSPWLPRMLTYAVARLIRSSGLPRVRLHDLRHGHATHLLASNVHPKVVQERLGHASIQLTVDTYSHVMPSMQESAAETIDAAMRPALKRE
jgi:integrase